MRWKPRSLLRPARLLALGVLALTVVGCGPPEYQFTSNDATDLVIKLPRTWTRVASCVPPGRDGAPAAAGNWYAIYDAADRPDAEHVGAAHTTAPVAWIQTFAVPKETGESLTDDDLRDLLIPVTTQGRTAALLQGGFAGGGFRLISDQKMAGRTAHGVHVVFTYDLGEGSETFDKIVLIDKQLTRVHLLLVQCSQACYDRNRRVIDDSVRSFTVRTA